MLLSLSRLDVLRSGLLADMVISPLQGLSVDVSSQTTTSLMAMLFNGTIATPAQTCDHGYSVVSDPRSCVVLPRKQYHAPAIVVQESPSEPTPEHRHGLGTDTIACSFMAVCSKSSLSDPAALLTMPTSLSATSVSQGTGGNHLHKSGCWGYHRLACHWKDGNLETGTMDTVRSFPDGQSQILQGIRLKPLGRARPISSSALYPVGYQEQIGRPVREHQVPPAAKLHTELVVVKDMQSVVEEAVEEVLGHVPDPLQPLMESGLDSLGAVELTSALQERSGRCLSSTLLFDQPSISAITEYLINECSSPTDQDSHRKSLGHLEPEEMFTMDLTLPSVLVSSTTRSAPYANISGLASRQPRCPQWSDDFDGITPVPLSRWDDASQAARRESSTFGAFLDIPVAEFDAEAFSISEPEAALMDPQQRLLLETVNEALIDAGGAVGNGWATFVGLGDVEYTELLATSASDPSVYHATALNSSIASGRVSYAFGFHGSSVTVNTACSSSLVSVAMALEEIQGGGSHASGATASGVLLLLSPTLMQTLQLAGMLSPDGRCKTLDSAANGYVRGEGCVTAVIELAANATSTPRVLLAGTCVNQDGRSSSLTAPHGPSQQAVIRSALTRAMLSPCNLSGVTLHGTGTALGDPIEVGALASVLEAASGHKRRSPVAIDACKPRTAHAEAASGLISLLQAAKTVADSSATAILHLRSLNPNVMQVGGMSTMPASSDVSSDPPLFTMPRQPRPSEKIPGKENAHGVSAFAYSGTNAHAVLRKPLVEHMTARSTPQQWRRGHLWAKPMTHRILPLVKFDPIAREICLEGSIACPALSMIWDHTIQGQVLFPGAGYMEAAMAAASIALNESHVCSGSLSPALTSATIPKPLLIPSSETSSSVPAFQCTLLCETSRVKFSSLPNNEVHLSGKLVKLGMKSYSHDAPMLHHRSPLVKLGSAAVPNDSRAMPMATSDVISLPSSGLEWTRVHPAALDGVLQLGAEAVPGVEGSTYVPAGLGALTLTNPGQNSHDSPMQTSANLKPKSTAGSHIFEHSLLNGQGLQLVHLQDFVAKKIRLASGSAAANGNVLQNSTNKYNNSTLQVLWEVAELSPSRQVGGAPQEDTLKLNQVNSSENCLHQSTGRSSTSVEALLQCAAGTDLGSVGIKASQGMALGMPVAAHGHNSGNSHGQQAALWGMMQTAALETAGAMAISAVCKSPLEKDSPALTLQFPPKSKGQIKVSNKGTLLNGTLVRSGAQPAALPYCLVADQRGTFGCLRPEPVPTSDLGQGEVCLRVQAVGINFRDVLNVLGMYPGDPGSPGADVSGVVVDIGPDVEHVRPGEAVFGVAIGCLGSHVICNAETLIPLPPGMTFAQAATVPTVFVTVDMALAAAGLKPGHGKMLVHGAAGGVGLAAIQMAHDYGLEVVATAGTAAKRSMLRSLGLKHVYDSRSTTFADGCAMVIPAGVDMVLNSLTSSGMFAASVSCLGLGGAMVELSKRDIWSHLRTNAERSDVQHNLLAMDFMTPKMQRQALIRVGHGLASGRLRALPGVVHSMANVQAALRQMSQVGAKAKTTVKGASFESICLMQMRHFQGVNCCTVLMQARHIGKIVVAQPEDKPIGAKGRYATVAITGGLGMLGNLMASWLLQHCVSHILLMGRSATGDLQRLSSTCSIVTAAQVDGAAQEDAMMLQNPGGPGVSGFFHAGGVLSDATLPRQTASAMRMAFGPKAAGALCCSAALKGVPIQTRVLFSSTSALLGSPGQASYAAANSSLDGLAASWDAQGDAAVCVQWGPWGGGGMALQDAGTSKRLERWGMGLILPQVGLSALEGALHAQQGCRAPCGFPHVAVAPMQWATFMQSPAAAQPGLGIDTSLCVKDATDDAAPSLDTGAEAAGMSSFESMLRNGDAAEVILAVVRRTAASVIGNPVDDCDPLFDAGLDSLGAVEFRNTLTMETGMTLSATLLFDYSTIAEVASCIESTIQVRQLEEDKAAESTDAPEGVPSVEEYPEVAEIGQPSYAFGIPDKIQTKDLVVTEIAARLPGGLFSDGCAQQHDASSPILLPRWDVDMLQPTHLRTTGRHGMLLDDDSVYCFDSSIFRIHNSEAAVMDPQQRVLLDTAMELGGSLMGREANNMSVGVYLGIWPGFYHEYLLPRTELGAYHATGSAISAAAGRVSFMFGFTGPSISVDTACSASMIATHLAANGVRADNCQTAVSAGVGLLLTPTLHTLIGSAGMLSPEARCKALDASADGYVRAEACVCMAIEQTEAQGHHLAVIHGSAVNQDARSSSLTSPSGRAQQAVIQSSCRQAGVLPSALRAAQLHSTGTSLGDPIEIGAVCGVLNGSNDPGWLHLQACKSNAGHTEAAAGATGLLYAFELQARQSVLGLQHLRNLNPHVSDLKHSTQACTLVAPRQQAGLASMTSKTLVGTSSFAFQGTNGHLISSSASSYANLGVSSPSRLCSWEARSPVIVKRLESHYFLQSCKIIEERVAFEGCASQARASFLWDHSVRGRVLMPGAGLLDAAHACTSQMLEATQIPALCNVSLIQPLQLPETGSRVPAEEQRICCVINTGTRRMRITSEPDSHVHMMASLACVSSVPPLAAALQRPPCAAIVRQWALSPQTKPLQVPCADVAAPTCIGAKDDANTVPMILDSCLHLGQQIRRKGELVEQPGVTYIPMGIESVVLVGRLGSCGRTLAVDRGLGGGGSLRVDHVFQSLGEAGGRMAGFEAKPFREPSSGRAERKGRATAEASSATPALVRVHWGVDSPCSPSLSLGGAHDQQASLKLSKRDTKSFVPLNALSSCICIEAALQTGAAADSKSLTCIGGLSMAASVSDSVATPVGTAAFSDVISQGAIRGMLQTSALELGGSISTAAFDMNRHSSHEPALTLESRAGGAPSQLGFNAVASGCTKLTGILNQHENPQDFPGLVHDSLTRAFANSTVLITGGLGMLGRLVAGWLLQRSRDTHVLLLGRTAHSLRHGSFTGTQSLVTSQSCDVSTAEDSSYLSSVATCCETSSGGNPLGGIFHASGSLADATLQNQTASGMRVAAGGKVIGALQLQKQLQCSALSVGVMFSSTAALLGSQGQASYASSNAALDNLCTSLQQQGRNEISVQWGPWSGGGMASQDAGTEARMRRMGIGLLSPMDGLEALCHVLSHNTDSLAQQPGVLAVCPMDWNTFRKTPTGQKQMLEIASAEPEPADTNNTARSNTTVTFKTADAIVEEGSPQLMAQAAMKKRESVRSAVNSALQTVLGTEVEENEPFTSAGMDSLGAVELKSALQQEIGLNLPATIVFDYPTAAELVGHLESLVPGADDGAIMVDAAKPANHAPAISAPSEVLQSRNTFIYNVASKLPTGMDSLLTQCAPSTVPVSRWDVESESLQILQPAARHAKLVLHSDVSMFDADLFGVAGTEASLMDPQQRMLLEVTAEPVMNCVGQTASVGVFVGIWEPDYNHDIASKHVPQKHTSPFQATGSVMSVAAGRISFMFGLKGPCMSIDTACSASLVATHLASQAILQQECAAGLASGANLVLSPGKYFTLVAANMLSPSGQCQTLDSTADGYVRGEAVICLLLSQQDLEGQQGSAPLAVLKGSSINQDGRSSSLTSPHGPSQQNVISVACDVAGVSPSDLDAIQTHGTGTQLGDPIEVGAIRAVSNTSSLGDAAHHVLALQACKSFLGHGEAAAGSAGMLAALAGLGRSSCQAFPHLRHVNPHVMANLQFDLDDASTPVILASRQSGPMGSHGSLQPLVGVSSFAYQGTNSHVVTSGVSSGCRSRLTRSHMQNWSRRRFWAVSARHHYVLAAAVSVKPGLVRLQGEVATAALAFVADHVVQSKVLVPGAAFLELAGSAASLVYKSSEDEEVANGLRNGSIIAPFLLDDPLQQDQTSPRLITVDIGLANGKIDLGQASGDTIAPKQQRHLSCWIARVRGWNQRPVEQLSACAHSALLLRNCNAVPVAGAGPVATVSPHGMPENSGGVAGMAFHPAVVDSSLHMGHLVAHAKLDNVTYVPSGFDSLMLTLDDASCDSGSHFSSANPHSRSSMQCVVLNYNLAHVDGKTGISLGGFQAKPLRQAGAEKYRELPAPVAQSAPSWLSVSWLAATPPQCNEEGAGEQACSSDAVIGRVQAGHHLATTFEGFLQQALGESRVRLSMPQPGMAPSLLTARPVPSGMPGTDSATSSSGALWGLVQTVGLEHRGGISATMAQQDRSSGAMAGLQVMSNAPEKTAEQPNIESMGAVHHNMISTSMTSASASLPVRGFECLKGTTWAISGGMGMLGLLTGRWLQARGVSRLLLLGRSAHACHDDMAASEGLLCLTACDVSAKGDLPLMDDPTAGSIYGVISAGGVLSDATLGRQTARDMRTSWAPKVRGALNAWENVKCHNVQVSVLYSSIASLLGSAGQASYASSNAAADALAASWRAQGISGQSIQWGPWGGGGMAHTGPAMAARMLKLGIGMLSPAEGMLAFSKILGVQNPVVAVIDISWNTYVEKFRGVLPLLSLPAAAEMSVDHAAKGQARDSSAMPIPRAMETDLVGAADFPRVPEELTFGIADDLSESILRVVRGAFGADMANQITEHTPLSEAGLDSLSAVELRDSLEESMGISMPSTVIFDYPTVKELAEWVAGQVQPVQPQSVMAPATVTMNPLASMVTRWESTYNPLASLPICLTSISAKMPNGTGACTGMSANLGQTGRVPLSRWDFGASKGPQSPGVNFGKFLTSDPALFDSAAFGISGVEAVTMDPQQRQLLECITDVTVDSGPLDRNTGVFLGIWPTDYADLIAQFCSDHAPYNATGAAISAAVGRMSYTFGFQGPSVSIDTACSAALVGVHWGRGSLQSQECSAALCCGVNMILTPTKSELLSSAGMLSATGSCKALDADADGYARGEAIICMLLQPGAEGGEALALVPGSFVNQDGRSSSLTAPSGPSQQAVIRQACASAFNSPSDLGAAQMHGTGTSLGDPIEVGALASLFTTHQNAGTAGSSPLPEATIRLQASKSSNAHCEAAAGLVGMLGAMDMHIHQRIAPIQHLRVLNAHVEPWIGSISGHRPGALLAGRVSSNWAECAGRGANVSSFAYQGTNCSVIVDGASMAKAMTGNSLPVWEKDWFWAIPAMNHRIIKTTAMNTPGSRSSSVRFEGSLHTPGLAFLCDHFVQEKALVPGACFIEAAAVAGEQLQCGTGHRSPMMLASCSIPEPMFLSLVEQSGARLLVDVVIASGHLQVRSSNGGVSFDGHLCQAATSAATAPSVAKQQLFLTTGRKSPGPCVVAMPAARPPGQEPWVVQGNCSSVHPATLDACFQLGHEVEVNGEEGATYVPSGLQGLVLQHHSSNVHTSVQAHPDSRAACVRLNHGMGCDKSLSNTSICGFEAKPIKARRHRQSSTGMAAKSMHKSSLMEVIWAVEAPEDKAESFLGAPACTVHSTEQSSLTAASESLLQQGLLLPGQTNVSVSARSLTGASGAVAGTNASLDSSAGIWGLMQTATAELKGSGMTVSVRAAGDTPRSSTVHFPSGKASAPASLSRTGARHQGILVQSSAVSAPGHHQLLPNGRGTFGCLEARPLATSHLTGQEVCVKVHAVGINFRDVLNVLGMYPGDPGPPGADMSGVVTAVGPDVVEMQPGQAVFGLAAGCLGSHVICKEETLAALPSCLSYQQAATVPTVFVTVDMALEAAKAKEGDVLLVHGGAGGIGLASVRMARCLGLEVVATAGSASKRCVLRTDEGVSQVLDSRATAFAGELPSLLPQGVQIVLNSLTSSGMVAASLASLAPGGCFVELSKRDIWSSGRIVSERPDVRYQLVAMDFLPGNLLSKKLANVAQRLSRGRVAPLPSVVHSMSSVTVALRQMSQVCFTAN